MILWLTRFAFVVAVALCGFAVLFLVSPEAALDLTDHQLETLPFVMGGRYGFFALMILFVLWYGDHKVTAALFLGFAGLGFLDAVLYRAANPWPHGFVGLLALAASTAFYRASKKDAG